MKYDRLTRIFHILVALGVVTQMLTSLVMVAPKPGRTPNEWFETHETVGLSLLAVLSLYWLWIVARTALRGEANRLFPWFSRQRRADLWADMGATMREVRHGRLPNDDRPRPLPAAVQGAGLSLALVLAATGSAMALGMAPDGAMSAPLHAIKEVHETLASLMWVYLAVHPPLGLLHQLAGHRSLNRMFTLR